jgi:hypothetical protein
MCNYIEIWALLITVLTMLYLSILLLYNRTNERKLYSTIIVDKNKHEVVRFVLSYFIILYLL